MANCSAFWVTATFFETGVPADVGGRELSRGLELDADRVLGGGVGRAFGATD